MTNKFVFVLVFFWTVLSSVAQSARVKGLVLDNNNLPISNVNVSGAGVVTQTNSNGFYSLLVPSEQQITLVFTHVSLKKATVSMALKNNEVYEFHLVMNAREEQMGAVVITSNNKKNTTGITSISPEMIRKIPGANAGIENILKTLAGVNSNNELSTQYAVRGGNYDENLVYVNEIEVYRPFLIRSGQQEGLSFTNTDLVQNVDFSAGGFQAKFGDKLASVLDITYRTPTKFASSMELSFLGGSLALDAVSKNNKWAAVTGVRYRNNSLLVKSQDTQTNYTPSFVDLQTHINYQASVKWNWSFVGNISQNNYNYKPLTKQTKFGTISNPIALLVYYQGQEKDQYSTYFGALKTTFKPTETLTLKWISSLFHTQEQEHFDILAQYQLGEIDTNIGSETFGNVNFSRGVGSQLNHARNDLDALIANIELKGFLDYQSHTLEWGAKYTHESIRDRVVEWEVIDSAGFSINPVRLDLIKKDEPYAVYSGPLAPYQSLRAQNATSIHRFSGYLQWSKKGMLNRHAIWYNAGVRMQDWQLAATTDGTNVNQFVISPRAQFAIKPNWEQDMVFKISGGMYHQPPFYRELRAADGVVRPNVKAQQALHVVLSNDYSFTMWSRPFKFITELYYKNITNVNTYTIDNVRIRYAATNNAKAYVQGIDLRWNGEFVPGSESWFSFGYLKTEENTNNRGYIARPTDQRLKFGVLFQDYMPNIPTVKLHLNLVYNTGLPGGSPAYADPYLYQNRLNDYRRVDIGFSKVFIDGNHLKPQNRFFKNCKELTLGFEIFNLFNNQNAITNTFVRDVYSKNEYAIPNYMTTRVFNLKLNVRL
ncbi:TonB-dependent receptor [Flavobacterium crassostreae]|uniref:TonB-dependent receptor n=1 Tax=Flavobacterium crassostreae TaxID=1763534 RepID=A0A1B9E832_9FLAO|nr:TonB-dependent receptor [Flavobacterium crassostreae]